MGGHSSYRLCDRVSRVNIYATHAATGATALCPVCVQARRFEPRGKRELGFAKHRISSECSAALSLSAAQPARRIRTPRRRRQWREIVG